MIYDMMFINCKWISDWSQWSAILYNDRNDTTPCMGRNNVQNNSNHRSQKIKSKHKKGNKHKKVYIKKHKTIN
jgi:hypothetical protein